MVEVRLKASSQVPNHVFGTIPPASFVGLRLSPSTHLSGGCPSICSSNTSHPQQGCLQRGHPSYIKFVLLPQSLSVYVSHKLSIWLIKPFKNTYHRKRWMQIECFSKMPFLLVRNLSYVRRPV